ncbi:MAG TPA: hypothetical protein DCZ94_18240 [Lentisphaeria bacterium]|nr:MAG: hypothetical protein A2X48_22945 [Lentisphaerae bacterium GWF2_49_21]HBC88887.1 hypothetical protein [Lentisphaeria bacterium]
MNKKWLLQEIETWISAGIIDRAQADRISAIYPETKPSRNWGALIFSVIGAIIFGLGIILLFAYNWDAIPKFAKLAIIFSALAGAHGAGFYFRTRGEKFSALSEAMFALGTMLFGSGIWLIAQIYNIDEHYPNAFIVWGAGALLLAWSLPSVVQGTMASILFVLWNSFENFDFDSKTNIAPFLILICIFPLAWKMRSKILMAVAIPAFVLSILFNCHWFFERVGPSIFISVAGLLIGLSIIVRKREWFPETSGLFTFYGNILYWSSLYVFTFPAADSHIFRNYWYHDIYATFYVLAFAAAAIVAWSMVILPLGKIKEDLGKLYRVDHFAVPVTVLAVTLNFGWLSEFGGWGGAAVFNLVFLFQSVMLIAFGCRNLNSKLTAAGTIMLAFLAFARYADLFDSLLVRGIVFLGVGAGIFIVGMLYARRKKEAVKT